MRPTFGLDRAGKYGAFDELLQELPAVRPTTAETLGLKAYQTEYGIFDHNNPSADFFDTVVLHPKENVYEGGFELTHVRRFYNNKYGEAFNISLNEYFALPFAMAQFLYELVGAGRESAEDENRRLTRELEELKREMNK